MYYYYVEHLASLTHVHSGTLCLFVKLLLRMAIIIQLVKQLQLLLNQSNQAKSGIEIVVFSIIVVALINSIAVLYWQS